MKPKVIFRKKQRRGKKVKEGWEEGRDGEQEGTKQLHHSKLRLEKEMASHSSILAREISRTREV